MQGKKVVLSSISLTKTKRKERKENQETMRIPKVVPMILAL
jgi:hypothetical protein